MIIVKRKIIFFFGNLIRGNKYGLLQTITDMIEGSGNPGIRRMSRMKKKWMGIKIDRIAARDRSL